MILLSSLQAGYDFFPPFSFKVFSALAPLKFDYVARALVFSQWLCFAVRRWNEARIFSTRSKCSPVLFLWIPCTRDLVPIVLLENPWPFLFHVCHHVAFRLCVLLLLKLYHHFLDDLELWVLIVESLYWATPWVERKVSWESNCQGHLSKTERRVEWWTSKLVFIWQSVVGRG